jgi:signal transduction histidine kinase
LNHAFLTADSFLALLAVVINSVFAALVLFRTSKTIVFRTFFLICIATIIWNLGDFMVSATGGQGWFYFSLTGTAMLPVLMFHFISTLVNPQEEHPPFLVPGYAFAGFLAATSPLAIVNTEIRRFVDGFAWNVCYLALLVPVFFWSIVTLRKAMRQAAEDEKERLRYIFIAVIIGVLTGLTDLVQILRISVPPLGHIGTVVYSSVLAIGVFKHRAAYDILAQMRENLGALSEMAAGIAHEIRNPLGSLKGASNLLNSELKDLDHARGREYLTIITEEIERLNNILTNFQYFTKPLKIEKEPVPLNEVIRKTVTLAGMDTPGLSIRSELSAEVGLVRADASSLKQVFLNLIKNAADACNPKGELIIQTECDLPWVRISFSDNGPGIEPRLLDHIFEPFFPTKTAGVGVGLAISRRIIEAHNGRIEAVNVLPKGTRFSILLPREG